MTRAVTISLGLFLIATTMLGLFAPHTEIESVMSLGQNGVIARLSAAALLIFYGTFRNFRLPAINLFLKASGLVAIGMGTVGIFIFYLLPIDIFQLLTVGIFALLASIELPVTDSPSMPLKGIFNPQIAFPNVTRNFQAFIAARRRPMAQG